jgi:hypothetical protein
MYENVHSKNIPNVKIWKHPKCPSIVQWTIVIKSNNKMSCSNEFEQAATCNMEGFYVWYWMKEIRHGRGHEEDYFLIWLMITLVCFPCKDLSNIICDLFYIILHRRVNFLLKRKSFLLGFTLLPTS